jgi:hypothetical protein
MRVVRKGLTGVLAAAAALCALAGASLADPVTITGSTTGAFGAGCAGCTVSASGTSISNSGTTITFTPGSFNVTLSPPGEPGANFTFVNLGTLTTTAGTATGVNFGSAAFTLNVNITAPGGVGSQNFQGVLNGQVFTNASTASITWGAPTALTFTGPAGQTFTLLIEPETPVNNPGDDRFAVRARLTLLTGAASAAIPEPASLLLIGTGLLGLAGVMRKKVKQD